LHRRSKVIELAVGCHAVGWLVVFRLTLHVGLPATPCAELAVFSCLAF
jgi:hypothetical protein